MNKKVSGQNLVSSASEVMRLKSSSKIEKSLAASVLSQSMPGKMTGKEMERKASMVLKSDKYSDTTKSFAASILSQSDKNR